MLAYVFWHGPRAGVAAGAYEAALTGYHRSLGAEAIDGVHGSQAFRIEGSPWLAARPGYEDWYLLDGSYAIDNLNTAAVTGPLEAPHRQVAGLCGVMAAGLYELVEGEPDRAGLVSWVRARPRGGSALWRRRMVLGPTPEFAVAGLEVPGAVAVVRRTDLL